jgi:hypothetical protein
MKLIREDAAREGHDLPCLVLFITDGGTSNPAVVVRQMTDAERARYPPPASPPKGR